jgi:hypothetical protein
MSSDPSRRAQVLLDHVRAHAMPQGAVPARGFRLRQSGEMRLGPDKPWRPFRAEQWFGAPGLDFRWTARARMAGLLPVTVVDSFEHGHGSLTVRLAGVIPLARSSGPEMDRGEMMRALAELPWRPAGFSLAAAQIEWSAPGPQTLRAAFGTGPARACVDLEVDAEGRVLAAFARDRPRGVGAAFVSTPWHGTFAHYLFFQGFRVPAHAEVAWLLPEGPFTYFRANVERFSAIT